MTTELLIKTFQEHFNIQLEPDDPSYSLDWFRTEIDGIEFQLGVTDGQIKINIDLGFIGYDAPQEEAIAFMDRVNKKIGINKRVYLGEADWYYRIFAKKGVLETVTTGKEIIALVQDFLDFGNNEEVNWLK